MKLIEVVIGKQTSDETKERALAFARQIGKLPVVVKDSPGFLVNRVLFPYLLDAAELFEQGVDAKKIDDALVEWGMPMGPLRLIDEIGVDITVDIAATLEKSLGARARTPAILHEDARGKHARPQDRERLLQIRRQNSNRLTRRSKPGATPQILRN